MVALVGVGRSIVSAAVFQGGKAPARIEDAKPSLVYALHDKPTTFVLSRPQQVVRILTNADLRPGASFPRYGLTIEGLGAGGKIVWRSSVYARSIRLFVRSSDGRLLPHTFRPRRSDLVTSAADVALFDFGQPVEAVRLTRAPSDPGVGEVLVRVQERRNLSARQLDVGWDRLSSDQRADLTSGNPLGSELTTEEERRRLLVSRWHPVGPSGVDGQDYRQVLLYERTGPIVSQRNVTT
jgi:hypothetical protein